MADSSIPYRLADGTILELLLVDIGGGLHAPAKTMVDLNGDPLINREATLLASAARTASINTADQDNPSHKGVTVNINVTASADTPSIVATIQGKDSLSGNYYTLLASAAITGAGLTTMRVYPGLVVTANLSASHLLPRLWRVSIVAADSDSITYSVGACLHP